jgi:uncharacterized protein (DUF697 family)
MKTLVQRIIDQTSAVAAGAAVLLSPVPFADEALLMPLLGAMTFRIGRAHGLRWNQVPWKAVTKTAAGGLLARATVNLGVSYVPFVAAVANAASAATLTGAFGVYADRACKEPAQAHLETLQELKVDVRELTERWRRLCSRTDAQPDVGPASQSGGPSMSTSTGTTTGRAGSNGEGHPNLVAQVVQEVRADIEHTLRTRHVGHGEMVDKIEDRAKALGLKLWQHLKARPYAGIAGASVIGFTLASATGVGELGVALLCGYAAYEVLRRGRPVNETVEEVMHDVEKMA